MHKIFNLSETKLVPASDINLIDMLYSANRDLQHARRHFIDKLSVYFMLGVLLK